MDIIHANQDNFDAIIRDSIVLVDFFATWCGPCKMLGPVLEEMASERSSVKIVKVDIDEAMELARRYGIMSVPTMLLFKDGKLVDQVTGFMPKMELTNWINERTNYIT